MERRLHVFILVDALGWRYLRGREFLNDLLPERRPLRTVLGYSPGAIPAILTGRMPAETGRWNLFYYDPQGSPFRWLTGLHSLPAGAWNSRVVRKLLTLTGRHLLGLGRLFDCAVSPRLLPYFNWCERGNIFERGAFENARSIFDELFARGVPYRSYSYHRWTDLQILQHASVDMQRDDVPFYFLYLSELDRFLHQHCTDAAMVERRLAWYAARIRPLLETARRIDPAAVMAIFSDHGMTPVHSYCSLKDEVAALGFSEPGDYLCVYDSTMARFWFRHPHVRAAIEDRLRSLECGRILPDEELRQLGVLFPDRRYGETIFLLDPGWLVTSTQFHGRGWMPAGMHGYHPDHPDSDGVLLTAATSTGATGIADVFSLMMNAARLVQPAAQHSSAEV